MYEPRRSTTGPDIPRDAKEVTVGRFRAWFPPPGYVPAGDGPALTHAALAHTALIIDRDGRDLVIGATGLSRSALVSLVSAGLSAA